MIKIPFRNGKTNQLETRDHPLFLPHELFAYAAKRPHTFTKRIIGEGDSAANFWSACREED